MSKEQPSYYANIPADVRYDDDLTANEKLMYGEITCLTNKEGYCWAGNEYFSELYGVTKNSVSRWLRHLEKRGYINRELIRNDKKQVIKRKVYITGSDNSEGDTSKHESVEGIDNNVKDNTTSNNTTSNNNMSSQEDDDVKEVWQQYKEIFADYYNPRKFSKKRKSKIKQRLKTYTVDELVKSMKAISSNDYMIGKNDNNKFYAKPEYCFRNDEKVEEWLNDYEQSEKTNFGDKKIDYYADLREE